MTDIKLTNLDELPADRFSSPNITLAEDTVSENFIRFIRIEINDDNESRNGRLIVIAFQDNMSKADAILALQEAIAWIEGSHGS